MRACWWSLEMVRWTSMIRRNRLPLCLFGHLVIELGCGGPFLARVFEHAQPFETLLLHEAEQLLKVVLGFTRETDDERRTQRDPGHRGAKPVRELAKEG